MPRVPTMAIFMKPVVRFSLLASGSLLLAISARSVFSSALCQGTSLDVPERRQNGTALAAAKHPPGLKPLNYCQSITARLKSCPDTNQRATRADSRQLTTDNWRLTTDYCPSPAECC